MCTTESSQVDPGVLQSGLWDAEYMQILVKKQQESAAPAIAQQLRKLLQLYVGASVQAEFPRLAEGCTYLCAGVAQKMNLYRR